MMTYYRNDPLPLRISCDRNAEITHPALVLSTEPLTEQRILKFAQQYHVLTKHVAKEMVPLTLKYGDNLEGIIGHFYDSCTAMQNTELREMMIEMLDDFDEPDLLLRMAITARVLAYSNEDQEAPRGDCNIPYHQPLLILMLAHFIP